MRAQTPRSLRPRIRIIAHEKIGGRRQRRRKVPRVVPVPLESPGIVLGQFKFLKACHSIQLGISIMKMNQFHLKNHNSLFLNLRSRPNTIQEWVFSSVEGIRKWRSLLRTPEAGIRARSESLVRGWVRKSAPEKLARWGS